MRYILLTMSLFVARSKFVQWQPNSLILQWCNICTISLSLPIFIGAGYLCQKKNWNEMKAWIEKRTMFVLTSTLIPGIFILFFNYILLNSEHIFCSLRSLIHFFRIKPFYDHYDDGHFSSSSSSKWSRHVFTVNLEFIIFMWR